MENQQQPTKTSNPTTWVVLVIVIIIALGVGAYFLFFQEDETNTNNTNTTVNTNTVVNENINAVSNTNTVANTNVTTNTNTAANSNTNTAANANVDTSGWLTYKNEEYGYSFMYPDDMSVQDYSSYNENVYNLTLLDDKTVPLEGGAIPISVKVFENTAQEVNNAVEDKDGVLNTWNEISIGGRRGEYSVADQGGTVNVNVYVIPLSGITVLIKTTNPSYILPTFQFSE